MEIETPIDQQTDLISIEIEIFPAKIYFGLSASGLNSNPPLPVALGLAEGWVPDRYDPSRRLLLRKVVTAEVLSVPHRLQPLRRHQEPSGEGQHPGERGRLAAFTALGKHS